MSLFFFGGGLQTPHHRAWLRQLVLIHSFIHQAIIEHLPHIRLDIAQSPDPTICSLSDDPTKTLSQN